MMVTHSLCILLTLSHLFTNAGKVQFVKVDTDVHEEYVDKYNIQGLPLFAIFKNGEVKAQHSGALTRDNLRAFIEKNVN